MPDWACTRCGSINLDGQVMCEGCGAETRGKRPTDLPRGMHVVRSEPLPTERPCTLEQSKAANHVLQDVLERRMTVAEGRKKLSELFGMPELVELT